MADFPSQFSGDGDDAAKIVAVMESIVFLLAVNLEKFAQYAPNPERMIVTGGLATVDPLCQRLADLCGLSVTRPVVSEATAKGIAYLSAGRPANWKAAAPGTVFKPRANAPFEARYRQWRRAMDQLLSALD